jgi:cell division transport system ATP-binding protein
LALRARKLTAKLIRCWSWWAWRKKPSACRTKYRGGEQQKVSIARAIVNSPPILLADEPTGNLAPETSWEIIQLLGQINQRHTTVVVATHDQSIVSAMRKRVITLHEGKLLDAL